MELIPKQMVSYFQQRRVSPQKKRDFSFFFSFFQDKGLMHKPMLETFNYHHHFLEVETQLQLPILMANGFNQNALK